MSRLFGCCLGMPPQDEISDLEDNLRYKIVSIGNSGRRGSDRKKDGLYLRSGFRRPSANVPHMEITVESSEETEATLQDCAVKLRQISPRTSQEATPRGNNDNATPKENNGNTKPRERKQIGPNNNQNNNRSRDK